MDVRVFFFFVGVFHDFALAGCTVSGMNEDEDSVDGDFSSSDVGSSGSHLLLSPDPGRPSGSFPPSSPSPPDSVASR